MEVKTENKLDVNELANQLINFSNYAEDSGSLGSMYGVKMDKALASDLLNALTAYGLDFEKYRELKKNLA